MQVLSEEREELKATLDAQDQFVRSTGIQQQQLRREVTRLNQTLQAKEQVIRYIIISLSILCANIHRNIIVEFHKVTCKPSCFTNYLSLCIGL